MIVGKGKIDKNGQLWIERAGKLKDQYCPWDEARHCGDWCPKFEGPREVQYKNPGRMSIELKCPQESYLEFIEFTDERLQ